MHISEACNLKSVAVMKGLYICYTDDIIKKISRTAKIRHDKK